jgi:hypothetical protein
VDALKVGNGAGEENLDLCSGSAGSLMEYHAAAVGSAIPLSGAGSVTWTSVLFNPVQRLKP